MKIKVFINNEFGENCYVAFDESSKEAIIIDPGMVTEKEQQKVGSFVKDNELTINKEGRVIRPFVRFTRPTLFYLESASFFKSPHRTSCKGFLIELR